MTVAERHRTLSISIRDYERVCESLLERMFVATDRVLDDVVERMFRERDVLVVDRLGMDEVILVGAATRMPMVRRRLENLFEGKRLDKTIDADRAVAVGAAIKAAKMAAEISQASVNSEPHTVLGSYRTHAEAGLERVEGVLGPDHTCLK